jgi:hypothetical protein
METHDARGCLIMVKLTAIVLRMMDERRKLVGQLVRDETRGRGLKSAKAAAILCNVGKVTMDRVRAGKPTVTTDTLVQIAGGFGWPLRLLVYIVEGDIEKVRQLPVGTAVGQVREDVLQTALAGMEQFPNPHE